MNNKGETVMEIAMVEITFMAAGVLLIASSGYFLYLMKEFKVLIAWSVLLAAVQISLMVSDYEIRWWVLAILPFYLFSILFMMYKIRLRINAALKRIEEIEREEEENATIKEAVKPIAVSDEPKEDSNGQQRHLPQ
jgi:hypothetical protein